MRKHLITSLVLALSLAVGHLGIAGPNCANENGDVNGDNGIDLSDAGYELAWLFQGGPFPAAFCTTPGPKEVGCAGDNGNTNGDASRDFSDVIYLLAWLFQGGPAPVLLCGGTPPEICDDLGVDEDGDGLTDCNDPDCAGIGNCPQPETDCTNGQDDDDDGDVDCADSDCSDNPSCPEDCEDGVDNDADGVQCDVCHRRTNPDGSEHAGVQNPPCASLGISCARQAAACDNILAVEP